MRGAGCPRIPCVAGGGAVELLRTISRDHGLWPWYIVPYMLLTLFVFWSAGKWPLLRRQSTGVGFNLTQWCLREKEWPNEKGVQTCNLRT